jgi:putative zinc finger protein
MRCRTARTLITQQLREALSPEQAAALTRHLGRCGGCRAEEAALRQLAARLLRDRPAPVPSVTPAAAEWTRRYLQAHPRRLSALGIPTAGLRLAPLGAVLAAGALLVGLTVIERSHRDPERQSASWPSPPAPLPKWGEGGLRANRITGTPLPEVGRGAGGEGRAPGNGSASALPNPRTPRGARARDHGVPTLPIFHRPGPITSEASRVVLNAAAMKWDQQPASLSSREWQALEERLRREVRVRDDFVTIPFPRLAAASDRAVVAATEAYQREAAVVDSRLAREVTCAFKATALSDLCDRLRVDTEIHLAAGNSVADEKVTVFCEGQPLRDVMRQLSRPFGYTWLRSGKPGAYRYELVQDLKSQLVEEELRNRDRNQALLALNHEMEKYRPYLELLPDEALARLKTARPEEKRLLEQIANNLGGWGPLRIYFRLSPSEMAVLLSGQHLMFREDPGPGDRPLPVELRRGIFQNWRNVRLVRRADGFDSTNGKDPQGLPLSAVPEARAWLFLELKQSQLGEYSLTGVSGYYTPLTKETPRQAMSLDASGPLAVGRSPEAVQPDNARINASFAHDPALQARISVQPPTSSRPERKVSSADVLEALYRATHMPIVADFYTRLYPAASVTASNQTLFAALNHLSDAMRLRWNKDARGATGYSRSESTRSGASPSGEAGAWLQFRSLTYYDDRRKEVPNRLLRRWQNSRRQHGTLTLEDLVEIAQLPEEQLQATDMAEGARECWGLTEWAVFANPVRHPYWRYLGEFTLAQRQQMQSPAGLPFAAMTLAQQQRFMAVGLEWESEPLQSLEELAGASLRVDYTVPGGFEWQPPGPDWTRYVVPVEPGRTGRRAPRPPARGQTRAEALETARRLFPSIRESLLRANRQVNPQFDEALLTPRESQIVPTRLLLEMVHIPGVSNKRRLHVVTTEGMGWEDTW